MECRELRSHVSGRKSDFVTEAGGLLKILCPVSDGVAKARRELKKYLREVEQERIRSSLESESVVRKTLADAADEFLKFKRGSKARRTHEYYVGYPEWLEAQRAQKFRSAEDLELVEYLIRLRPWGDEDNLLPLPPQVPDVHWRGVFQYRRSIACPRGLRRDEHLDT